MEKVFPTFRVIFCYKKGFFLNKYLFPKVIIEASTFLIFLSRLSIKFRGKHRLDSYVIQDSFDVTTTADFSLDFFENMKFLSKHVHTSWMIWPFSTTLMPTILFRLFMDTLDVSKYTSTTFSDKYTANDLISSSEFKVFLYHINKIQFTSFIPILIKKSFIN